MKLERTNWLATIFIALGSLVILFPLYLNIVVAVKSNQELAQSILAFPTVIHWENFTKVIKMTNFFTSFKNSAYITIGSVVLTLLTNSMVAYAIARNMDRKFFRYLYYYFVSAMFIPFAIIMLPIVKETASLGINNPTGLIFLYIVYGLAFNIFLYVGYIRSIPRELEQAAYVDGCGVWSCFWKIIFPLLAPINATVGILTCLWAWNDFMLPMVLLGKPDEMTLPLVQYVFAGAYSSSYNLAFASYIMVLSPVLFVYIFAQKWIISGITQGAVKG